MYACMHGCKDTLCIYLHLFENVYIAYIYIHIYLCMFLPSSWMRFWNVQQLLIIYFRSSLGQSGARRFAARLDFASICNPCSQMQYVRCAPVEAYVHMLSLWLVLMRWKAPTRVCNCVFGTCWCIPLYIPTVYLQTAYIMFARCFFCQLIPFRHKHAYIQIYNLLPFRKLKLPGLPHVCRTHVYLASWPEH